MKQKLKKLKRLFGSTLAGLLLFACQVDKDLTNENLYEKNGTIMHKKFEELIQETQFKTTFDKIYKPTKGSLNNGNATSRTVMENQYGFTISDYPANVVVSNATTSYTFLITREIITPNIFENLIVITKQNQAPKAFIIKYESSLSTINLPFNFFAFQGTKTLIPITYNASQITSKNEICEFMDIWICENHSAWEPGCTGHSGGSTRVCETGGGGEGAGNHGAGGGAGYGGGGAVNDISTAPVAPPPCTKDCPNVAPDPCIKIQKLLASSPVMSQELANLATQTSDVVEHGLYKLSNSPSIQPVAAGSNGVVGFPIPSTGQITMIGHTHNSPASNTYSIFSYDDFLGIVKLMKQGKISPDCVITLSTADGTNYAMLIDDQPKFLQFFALGGEPNFDMTIAMNRATVMMDYYDVGFVTKKPIIEENSTIGNLGDEKAFLDMIKDLNIGVSLLEANASFTTFTKVTHNKTTDSIDQQQPCN